MGTDKTAYNSGKGSRRAAKREEARGVRNKARAERAPVDLTTLDMELVREALHVAFQLGMALRWGTSRDGGAWAIGVYGDGEDSYTEYIGSDESINDYLKQLILYLDGLR